MPDNQLTEIICVIDRSGSMSDVKSDAIGGFNNFLSEQKKVPLPALFTLTLFNHEYEIIQRGTNIQDVSPLTNQSYIPTGTTALLDAVGRTIDDVGQRLAKTAEDKRPGKVLFVILTDGLENASKDYTRVRVREMIQHQQEKYGWRFEYLGANVDAFAEASALHIKSATAFAADAKGIGNVYRGLTKSATSYRTK